MTTVNDMLAPAPGPANLEQIVAKTQGRLLPMPLADKETSTNDSNSLGQIRVLGAAPPSQAGTGEITMIDQAKHVSMIAGCKALAVITPVELTPEDLDCDADESAGYPTHQIVVTDAHIAFAEVVKTFRPPYEDEVTSDGIHCHANIHPTARVSSSASVGADVTIGPGCHIHAGVTIAAGCRIGAECVLHPGVTLYPYTHLDQRVTLHAGTVVGANGFGYRLVDGRHVPTAQLGFVRIEADVEVGAGVTIDRGTYGATVIGEGTKIDNQVMIAHNCQIGKHNLICSQVGIAGSCTTGDYVVLAGQVGLADHVDLADEVVVCAQSGVMNDLSKGVYMGSPTVPLRDRMQIHAVQRKLPDMRRELKRLAKQVASLEKSAVKTQPPKAA